MLTPSGTHREARPSLLRAGTDYVNERVNGGLVHTARNYNHGEQQPCTRVSLESRRVSVLFLSVREPVMSSKATFRYP